MADDEPIDMSGEQWHKHCSNDVFKIITLLSNILQRDYNVAEWLSRQHLPSLVQALRYDNETSIKAIRERLQEVWDQ